MSDQNHPLKSSSGTAGIVAIIVSQVPPEFRKSETFIYLLSTVPPFLVWIQNWFWKSGAPLIASLPDKYKAWSIKRDLKKAIDDPLIQANHRSELTEAYSKTQTDNLKKRLAAVRDSL